MSLYQRRLPHWQPAGQPLFLTWRLHGTLPANRYFGREGLSSGRVFVCLDRYLDRAGHGPAWLRQDDIAQLVVDSLHFGQQRLGYYQLHAWVVMANRVHLLLTPLVPASRLQQSLKGFTARAANKILGRIGEPFWQRESYDHWVRSESEFQHIVSYIENNPVKTGIVACAEDYRWSADHKPT